MNAVFDRVILGAGLYGLYAAHRCGARGERVCVVERDESVFMRATYINQARVHMGYHYPRSLSTALKSARYFERFMEDYGFCVMSEFDQVYATSAHFSWTNAEGFESFCDRAGIRCDAVPPTKYFDDGMCDGAFLTTEYTYDARILRDHLMAQIAQMPNVEIRCGALPIEVQPRGDVWVIELSDLSKLETPFLLNATYAGINNVHALVGAPLFKIKYELCEIILCEVSPQLEPLGITVMDGPFFSIMPFGKTGLHSLTSVTFTPHQTSCDSQPTFECQLKSEGTCTPGSLFNCNECVAKPNTAWPFMSQLARKYLRPEYGFTYKESLYSMKPVLLASEVDDSRPTVVRRVCDRPQMVSVLSGKINTVYDLDPYLD